MRLKRGAARDVIIDAAAEIFREAGYERASMAAISARVGGSKTTLYNYFQSKEDLFAAAMMKAIQGQAQEMLGLLKDGKRDVGKALRAFGIAYLKFIVSDDVLSMTRTAIAEAKNAKLGTAFYQVGSRAGWVEIEAILASYVESGALRDVDTTVMALQLRGLLEAGVVEPSLYGATPVLSQETAVHAAVDTFLRTYAA